MKNLICILLILFSFTACDWSAGLTLEQWNNIINPPPDTTSVPIDTTSIPADTVCTSYTDILNPQFVSVWMEGINPSVTDYDLYAFPFHDTIHPSDNVYQKLDSLTKLFKTYYGLNLQHEIFINETDDRIYSIMFTGTNSVNTFAGKFFLKYGGNVTHGFGSTKQGYHSPSYSCENYKYVIQHYPSVSVVNFRDSPCDSLQTEELAWMIIDTANCKGGMDWFDMWFNQYLINPYVIVKAKEAGWYIPHHGFTGDKDKFMVYDMTGYSKTAIENRIAEGYAVKFKE